MKSSIKFKLMILTGLIVLVSLVILSIVFYWRASDFLNEGIDNTANILWSSINKEGELSVKAASNEAETWLIEKKAMVEQMSYTPKIATEIEEMPETGSVVEKTQAAVNLMSYCNKIYNNTFERGIGAVIVGNGLNKGLISSRQSNFKDDFDVTKEYWYNIIENMDPNERTTTFTSPYLDTTIQTTTVAVVTPITDEYNRLIGVGGMLVQLEYFKFLADELKVGKEGFAFIVDNNRKFISHGTNYTYANQTYSLTHEEVDTGYSKIDEAIKKRIEEPEKYQDEEGNMLPFDLEADIEGRPHITFVHPIEGLGWLAAAVPKVEITGQIDDMRAEMGKKIQELLIFVVVLSASLLLVTGVVIFFYSKQFTRPIQALVETMQEVEKGNLETKAAITSKDEIGVMAQVFNGMVNQLNESFKKIEAQNKEIRKYSEGLEDLVAKRTKDLAQALEEVTGLKVQQDGDYFLTSLLIKPLQTNESMSDKVEVEFYVSQKKKFSFKKWNAELGGDICIAHSVKLNDNNNDRDFTVFVNGDAMGKSIQGAGGSLVLGVVFNAFVHRTNFIPGENLKSPEDWLIKCYRELQDVFVSFDGTMLISVVIGIVDDESGIMYYFNAEHPWTVLYRSEKAIFTEEELLNRKIGTLISDGRVELLTLQLQKDDIVICGSDGRDDIILEYDEETGMRVINEDETLFLRAVEKGDGDLDNIVEVLHEQGEFSDDLSLLKIKYLGEKVFDEPLPEDYAQLKEEGMKAYQEKRFDEAVYKLEEAT